jgi:hypothetical protein
MAYDPDLAQRVREALAGEAGLLERKMFGGLAFTIAGNLAVSAYRDGGMMIRCAAEDWEAFTTEPGARPMLRKDKPVSGWVLIGASAVADEAVFARWVGRGLAYAQAQPPK